ncbi:MAG: acyl-CoA thioesterase [Desulfuromonas sp.]|nr:MAG: acyl-CoA thioesterase [Desulfuromonas sp.]
MATVSFTLTVRYAETDAQGIAHHSSYLIWFEEGRSEYLRQKQFPYSRMEELGYIVVVAEAELKYRAPAFYEDRVTVETTLERAKNYLLEFRYRARNQKGELLAEGRTLHVVLGSERKPTSLPADIVALLDAGKEGE